MNFCKYCIKRECVYKHESFVTAPTCFQPTKEGAKLFVLSYNDLLKDYLQTGLDLCKLGDKLNNKDITYGLFVYKPNLIKNVDNGFIIELDYPIIKTFGGNINDVIDYQRDLNGVFCIKFCLKDGKYELVNN